MRTVKQAVYPVYVTARDIYPDRSGDLGRITKISDFHSDRQWHNTGMYSDFYRPLGMEHDLALSLPAPRRSAGPGRSVRLFLLVSHSIWLKKAGGIQAQHNVRRG